MPANDAKTLTLIGGFQPEQIQEWAIPNPKAYYRKMRGFDSAPIRPGRTVLMVWNNEGGNGWDLSETNFVQRLVIVLK